MKHKAVINDNRKDSIAHKKIKMISQISEYLARNVLPRKNKETQYNQEFPRGQEVIPQVCK